MSHSWHELVSEAAQESAATLEKCAGDWNRPAGELTWSSLETASHLSQAVVGYAALLIAQPDDRYVALRLSVDAQASAEEIAETVRIGGALLSQTLRTTAPQARAWHPWGTGDPAGFAAAGVLEMLVHSRDIAQGFGVPMALPDELCAPVVERLFPGTPTGHRPSDTLLWCTGRAELPGLPRRNDWRWYLDVR
ncbi:maleylpyruvate isomerase N-terminal domain-containing protein [Streptomyces sp. TRM64462]|uniref:maleylpyruvate isomerase N-terminal domain-containing protein n=1 Tax=Streptomyces sp. TRM64462 TaxID=2741726 RepID=UPI0015860AC0|nr:maleylpyruvate isomerase N-terminal domain-containing protein [Streptomyces sp. TRM64462]